MCTDTCTCNCTGMCGHVYSHAYRRAYRRVHQHLACRGGEELVRGPVPARRANKTHAVVAVVDAHEVEPRLHVDLCVAIATWAVTVWAITI